MKTTQKQDLLPILDRLKNPVLEVHLEKLEDVSRILKDEQEIFWNHLLSNLESIINSSLYPDTSQSNAESSNSDALLEVQEFLTLLTQLACIVMDVKEPELPSAMLSLITVMVELLYCANVKPEVKAQIIKVCSLGVKKKIQMEESMLVKTFKFVVKQSLQQDALKADVHMVWTFRGALKLVLDSEVYYEEMKDRLLEIPTSKNFLKVKEGCNFIGYMMTWSEHFTLEIHGVIKKYLPHNKAEEYALSYYYAWNSSGPEMKKVLEKECVQFFMLKSLTLPRQNLNMIIAGQNALRILSQFHQQKHFPHVQKMLSTLYEPLLWRHLSSPNNTHRCNATEVLFDAYPLEKPGKGKQINDIYLNQQHDAITKLLTDKCHIVRIIAIRQVCKMLSCYWEAIPAETIHRWMKTISVLANDFSSFYVRRSVFKGLPELLTNAHASICLEQILPRFQKNFHDPNEQVRSAFVNMLLAVKTSKGKLKFWHIVPLEELVGRLEVENEVIGSKLVDLLFDSFFNPQFDEATIILRLVHLIALNCAASLKFFYFSKKRLPLEPAVKMMLDIISFVRGYVKQKLDVARETGISQSPSTVKKRKLFSGKENSSLDDSSVSESNDESSVVTAPSVQMSECPEDTSNQMPLDNPEISKGFLEIAGVIWQIHLKDIEKSENKHIKKQIYDIFEPCLNSFLQFFKSHTGLYSAVLGLCSFMPPTRLKYVSTVESCCVSQLKKMEWDNNSDKMLMFLVPLCMWGRGADVIEMAREWLKETFKKANLINGRRSSSTRRRVVNFKESSGPKPRLGLRLIDSILMIPRCKNKVFSQHSDELVQLWLYMGTIKELISSRLENGESFHDRDLCDTFLHECFDLYLTLMIKLNGVIHEEESINSVQEFRAIIEWASETLLLYVPSDMDEIMSNFDEEEDSALFVPFSVSVLNIVIKYATCLLPLGRVDLELVRSLAILIKSALSKGSRLLFVHSASVFVSYLIDYIKAYDKNDQLHLFRRVVLTLMKMILNAFSEHHIDQLSVKKCIPDLPKVKCTMNEVLTFSQRHSVKLQQNVALMFVEAAVNIIHRAMIAEEFEEPVEKISALPYLASQMVSLFVMRSPMAKLFCSCLEKYFSDYSNTDSTYFMAALHLFHVLSHASTRIVSEHLIEVLSTCKHAYKQEVMRQRSAEARGDGDVNVVFNRDGSKLLGVIENKLLGAKATVTSNVVQDLLEELDRCL